MSGVFDLKYNPQNVCLWGRGTMIFSGGQGRGDQNYLREGPDLFPLRMQGGTMKNCRPAKTIKRRGTKLQSVNLHFRHTNICHT